MIAKMMRRKNNNADTLLGQLSIGHHMDVKYQRFKLTANAIFRQDKRRLHAWDSAPILHCVSPSARVCKDVRAIKGSFV